MMRDLTPPDTQPDFAEDAIEYLQRHHLTTIPVIGKRPLVKWGRFQNRPPQVSELRSIFNNVKVTGIAVLNGPASRNLVCRDFDRADAYQAWADAHPNAAANLPTVRTRRGYHVYCRVVQPPRARKFSDGEFRTTGVNVLPPSHHPDGDQYTWVRPLGLAVPEFQGSGQELQLDRVWTEMTEQSERTEKTEQSKQITETTDDDKGRVLDEPLNPEEVAEIIHRTLPTARGQRNERLFVLARELRALFAKKTRPRMFLLVLQDWHNRARPVIGTKPFDDTWADFVLAWSKVKYPMGQGLIEHLVEDARRSDPPAEVSHYERTEVHLLASICRELQRAAGDDPFFLSCRKAGELIDSEYQRANRWLRAFEEEGLLEVVHRGVQGGRKANRYRYLGTL